MRGTRTKKKEERRTKAKKWKFASAASGAPLKNSRLFSSAFPIFCVLFSASTSRECEKGRPGTGRRGEETRRKMFEKLKSRKIALLRSDLVVFSRHSNKVEISPSEAGQSASSEIIDMKFIWLERRSTLLTLLSHNNAMAEVLNRRMFGLFYSFCA